uniref:Uncharacterized protein n=1 Tax=Anopheles coluzzii TaxID=1518534 RepID=A0A8W7PPN0_ANOCL
LRGVVLFNVSQNSDVVRFDKVNSNTLTPESTRTTDAMDVQLTVVRQIVVDDQRHLLHVDTARPNVGRDQHPALAGPELFHNFVTLLLRHVAVHRADGKVGLAHLLRQPVDLAPGVAEDDRLRDGQRVVQVAQRVELPLLPLDCHEELLDAFQRQFIALDQDADRVRHELGGHFEDFVRQGGGNQYHLRCGRQVPVHVVDLFLEAFVKHLVRFVQHQHLDGTGAQHAPLDHVEHAARRAAHHVLAIVQFANVLPQICTADAGVTLYVHEISQREDNLLYLHGQLARRGQAEDLRLSQRRVHRLQNGYREGGRLTRTGLCLCDDITTLHDWLNASLLDGGRFLKTYKESERYTCSIDPSVKRRGEIRRFLAWHMQLTVRVNTPQKLFPQPH